MGWAVKVAVGVELPSGPDSSASTKWMLAWRVVLPWFDLRFGPLCARVLARVKEAQLLVFISSPRPPAP